MGEGPAIEGPVTRKSARPSVARRVRARILLGDEAAVLRRDEGLSGAGLLDSRLCQDGRREVSPTSRATPGGIGGHKSNPDCDLGGAVGKAGGSGPLRGHHRTACARTVLPRPLLELQQLMGHLSLFQRGPNGLPYLCVGPAEPKNGLGSREVCLGSAPRQPQKPSCRCGLSTSHLRMRQDQDVAVVYASRAPSGSLR